MCNLFVIGNGFDLAHNMKTGFNNFREYLNTNYEISYKDLSLYVPDTMIGHHGEELQDTTDVVALIIYLLDEAAAEDGREDDWNKLEDLLGKLNLLECFDNVEPQYDKEGDRNYSWEYENAGSICGNMSLALSNITELLLEWIHTIEIPVTPIKFFSKIIHPKKDLFLTFNYTQTLEKLYKCTSRNVCHIHGMVSDDFLHQDDLILGHCGQMDYLNDERVPYDMGDGIQDIYESLRKNTSKQIDLHADFFKRLNNAGINKIYSFGFSFSDVDLPYMEELCNCVDTKNITWYLNSYGGRQERKEQSKKLRSCGFKGAFREYSAT